MCATDAFAFESKDASKSISIETKSKDTIISASLFIESNTEILIAQPTMPLSNEDDTFQTIITKGHKGSWSEHDWYELWKFHITI